MDNNTLWIIGIVMQHNNKFKMFLGWRYGFKENEAIGSVVNAAFAEHPGFTINKIAFMATTAFIPNPHYTIEDAKAEMCDYTIRKAAEDATP